MKFLRPIEIVAWILGLTLLAFWAGFWLHSQLGRRSDLARFHEAKAVLTAQRLPQSDSRIDATPIASPATTEVSAPADRQLATNPAVVDFSLWAEGRIAGYQDSLTAEMGAPQAILRIPELDLEVAVHAGTSELVLNRGAGWIEWTAGVEDQGNIGIAGHRDGFFRGLKELEPGDLLELETLTRTRRFEIDKISTVHPEDVWVLGPTADNRLTLVTCYPFYFVGKAPLRYIVHSHELVTSGEPAEVSPSSDP